MSDEQKLSPEIKAKWCEALRSGQYQQGKGQLRLADQFCCLGVLCDLMDPRWNGDAHGSGQVMFTPYRIRASVGLSVVAEGELMRMNDDGKSFAAIANYIEKNL